MKRKLISFDAFKKIEEASLFNTQEELIGAEDVLAKTLKLENLELFSFGESEVTYQADDGSFIHAVYSLDDEKLVLENIEQLVIEEESEKENAKNLLRQMLSSLLENNELTANQKFKEYISSNIFKREILEEAVKVSVSKPTGKFSPLRHKHQSRSLVAKRVRARQKTLRRLSSSQKAALARKRAVAKKHLGSSTNKRWRVYTRQVKAMVKEWTNLSENVYDYLDYKEFGPVMNESAIQTDEKGNIVAVAVPTMSKRNEGKILSLSYNNLDNEFKVLRGKMKKLSENQNFIKAIAELKRYNNISDNSALEEKLENVVSLWPNIILSTEDELTKQISLALESANITNYDDNTCKFIAEAILRTAHNAYTDKVKKIAYAAGVTDDVTSECKTCEDAYINFKSVSESYFSKLDESSQADYKVFEDLLSNLVEFNNLCKEVGDNELSSEIKDYIDECTAILNKEEEINLELAEEIADYLKDLAEANLDGSSNDWDVSNDVHTSLTSDNPRTSWNAKQTDAVPSKYTGDVKAGSASDGKSYDGDLGDEIKNNSWGNESGEGIYPDLENPYVPKSGTYKMKEKSVVDDDDSTGTWQSNDTWPNLKNPYVPASLVNKANSDNLLVDK